MVQVASKSRRQSWDFYPTPASASLAFASYVEGHCANEWTGERIFDPAVGDGSLVRDIRGFSPFWGERYWMGADISLDRAEQAEWHCEEVLVQDSINTLPWPSAAVIMNPPFSLLDRFLERALISHRETGEPVAVFTPTCWWQAEKRRHLTMPSRLLLLSWRPSFVDSRQTGGVGHKGSQDFSWALYMQGEKERPYTRLDRLEKPGVGQA